MNIDIDEILIKPVRGTVKYIFAAASPLSIAKQIAALANESGGSLILGIKDDGSDLHLKGYTFDAPKVAELRKLMGGFNKFEIFPRIKDQKKLFIIEVEKEINGVQVKNEYPVFINERSNKTKNIQPTTIFISYNHKVFKLADFVEEHIKNKFGFKAVINRDTRLEYKDDIEEYMKTIKQNDIVISLISDDYLKSEACMYEVTELMRDEKYIERLIFIIFNDEDRELFSNDLEIKTANVYGKSRYDYVTYWVDQKREYFELLKTLIDSLTSTADINATIKRIGRISDEVGSFVDNLNRLKGQNFTTMQNNNFEEISNLINKNLEN